MSKNKYAIPQGDTGKPNNSKFAVDAPVTAIQLFDKKSTHRPAMFTVVFMLVFFLGATVWSTQTPMAEISVSSGEIVPVGAIQRIQHLEGGILSHLAVKDGQHVTEGQLLVSLAPDIAQSELEQLETRLMAVTMKYGLLKSAAEGTTPAELMQTGVYSEIAETALKALNSRKQRLVSQLDVLRQQERERKAELTTITHQSNALGEQIDLMQNQVDGRQILVDKGLFPRLDFIQDQRELARLQSERMALILDADRINERVVEARQRMIEMEMTFHAELTAELSALATEAAELRLAIKRAVDRVKRLDITSPVSGYVKGIDIETIGGVITPGAQIMEIVPDDSELIVEARLSTNDVGHVTVGQSAKIKVLTYDYTRYGTIEGTVQRVSPSTFFDEDGTPFFKADIAMNSYIVGEEDKFLVSPGMTVLVDIITGEKTLFKYLASPIIKSFDGALHER
ncbi:HlyD family type I secretion periplasmic adaptor subunit [Thalassospira sp. MIT1370]|uniref:HlyD family type I secretion periplasmic adaptor subunit n=1 Tax=unclassified Thalassospira TaxID=2648997 RepID=UPI00399ABAF8